MRAAASHTALARLPLVALCVLMWAGPAAAVPGRAFDPGIDTWSREALEDGARVVKDAPLASDFLGDTSGMRPYTASHQAWFADGFQLAYYSAVVLQPWTNAMGRYHVTGQEWMRRALADALGEQLRPWRNKVIAPQPGVAATGGDLTIYGNVHQFKNSANDVEMVLELVAVDAAGRIQFKLQDIIGSSGTGGVAAAGAAAFMSSDNLLAASLNAGMAMALAMPSDRDQFGFYTLLAEEVARRVPVALYTADRQIAKGKAAVPRGPAVPLARAPESMTDARAESFGPALTAQVASYVAIVKDPAAPAGDRADRLRDLGKIGALAAVPVAIAIIQDDRADNRLQENAAWALGEIGHPDGLAALESAQGVDRFNVKAAIAKIREY